MLCPTSVASSSTERSPCASTSTISARRPLPSAAATDANESKSAAFATRSLISSNYLLSIFLSIGLLPSARVVRRVSYSRFSRAVALAALPLVLLALPARSAALPPPPLARFHADGAAATGETACGQGSTVVCSQVVVPLDRS